jgi:hypothetical protein
MNYNAKLGTSWLTRQKFLQELAKKMKVGFSIELPVDMESGLDEGK